MSEPKQDIGNPLYWSARLAPVRDDPDRLHMAVFRCPLLRWRAIEAKHREILAATIGVADKVLDVGCGWGRLLDLMPTGWRGAYIGVDISPEFIEKARQDHPGHHFVVGDIRDWERSWGLDEAIKMDWAVLISIRPMVRRELGDEVWGQMERELRRVARKLLLLEYDVSDPGSVE